MIGQFVLNSAGGAEPGELHQDWAPLRVELSAVEQWSGLIEEMEPKIYLHFETIPVLSELNPVLRKLSST